MLYGIVTSPASYCDCYLTGILSTWSWSLLEIAALPLPPVITNGAGHDASRIASHKVLAPLLFNIYTWLANHRLQEVCICWRPSNHVCWWRLASSGGLLSKDMATVGEYLQTWKLKLSTTKRCQQTLTRLVGLGGVLGQQLCEHPP